MGVVEGQNEPPAHIHIISTSSTSSTTADLTLTTATPSTKPSRALLPPYAHAPPRVHIPVPQDPRLEASHSEVESHDVSLAEDALVVCAGVIRGRVGAGLGEGQPAIWCFLQMEAKRRVSAGFRPSGRRFRVRMSPG